MSKKYLLLCNRHNSCFGDNWCLWWGDRESKSGYSSDVRIAHRFDEEEIKKYEDGKSDIPIPIDVLGISEEYKSEETINKNINVLIEKGTLNRLLGLELRPLFQEEDEDAICCPNCGSNDLTEFNDDKIPVFVCENCDYEFQESEVEHE
ncbi:hypothetical protein U728_1105 [Clostridium botulinum 202F]|nr:hypothetical protein U728_1105 [Clostridium botulinum 202F]KAI3344385.1 hypothetical protein CIT17_17355 [Clostridium botulinum]MBY6987094.1 hypothetical protein [Clostridium botulinum]NFH02178.1 hypothetical protein [Clostridium botulinum]NFP40491.1 hypothetical protein [Clostridium botulinum]